MVRIPTEYQEVEYIESTGTQYIITNYHPQTDWTAVDWTFAFTASQNGDQMLWGAKSSTSNRKVWQCEKYSGRSWYVACGSVSYRTVLADYGGKLNQIYTGHVDNTAFTVGGGSASPTQTNTGENESTMGIFCWNVKGRAEHINKGLKLYSLTFKENDIVSANFIPCYRKSDNEAGMYDTVSGTFYTNIGTGTFLVGNPVEYSTVSLLEARRRILLNTPYLESVSGATASFSTDMTSKLKECKIHFTPVQEGTGDPSPDNVRPIHGYDSITVYNGQTAVATIPFPKTIYGGYVDLVKGEVVEEWVNASIDELNWTLFTNTKSRQAWRTSGIATVIKKISDGNASPTAISQSFRQVSYNGAWGTYAISQSSQGTVFLTVPSSSYNTAEEFITALAGEIIVYQLATPTTYPLDPVTIRTLRGINNIWSDANGNIEVKFWTH